MPQKGLPIELKLMFLIALIAVMLLVFFVIIAVVIYSKKQKTLLSEKRLKETEFEKNLLSKELEKIKSLQTERERISQDMHDDIDSSLSTIKLQALLIKKKINDVAILEDVENIINDVSTINLSMRELIWSLQSQHDNLDNFYNYIDNYGRQLFSKTNIDYHFTSNETKYEIHLSAELRRNVFLIIKEAFNNIIKHSHATQIIINCKFENEILIITIEDNGIGIQQENTEGNGLINMKNRALQIAGNLSINSIPTKTSLLLELPIPIVTVPTT